MAPGKRCRSECELWATLRSLTTFRLVFTSSKSTMETPEKWVKSTKSEQ